MRIGDWVEKDNGKKHVLSIGPFWASVTRDDDGGYAWELYQGPILANSKPFDAGEDGTLLLGLFHAQEAVRERLKQWLGELDGDA